MEFPKWEVAGDLFEGCNCQMICPCHFSFKQRQTETMCQATWAFHIEQGHWDSIDLADANAFVVALSPGKTMHEGNWTSLLYVDDKASQEQFDALKFIFSGTAGGPWPRLTQFFTDREFKAVKLAPMEFAKEGRKFSLKVSNTAYLEVAAIAGADGQKVAKLTNVYNVIHGPEHTLARSNHGINDEGLHWDSTDTHGLYSRFRWSGP